MATIEYSTNPFLTTISEHHKSEYARMAQAAYVAKAIDLLLASQDF